MNAGYASTMVGPTVQSTSAALVSSSPRSGARTSVAFIGGGPRREGRPSTTRDRFPLASVTNRLLFAEADDGDIRSPSRAGTPAAAAAAGGRRCRRFPTPIIASARRFFVSKKP